MSIEPSIAITIISNIVFLALTAGYYRRTIADLEKRHEDLSKTLGDLTSTMQGVQIELAEWRGERAAVEQWMQRSKQRRSAV